MFAKTGKHTFDAFADPIDAPLCQKTALSVNSGLFSPLQVA
jgi:hypothetical protein